MRQDEQLSRRRGRLASLLAAVALSCSAPANVVVVSFDTLNIWSTGLFDPAVDSTPNLERLAKEGVLFEHAWAPAPLTLPSHATLFSGRSPESTGALLNGDRLGEDVTTLAEILGSRGYRTAAFPSLAVLKSEFGIARGFETYDDAFEPRHRRWYRTADEVYAAAEPWLSTVAASRQPFFLWAHFSDPHEPYIGKGAPADVVLTHDGVAIGEFSLARKESYSRAIRLRAGTNRLEWRSIRRVDADAPNAFLTVRVKNAWNLKPYLAGPPATLDDDAPLRPAWSLDLENRGDTEVALTVTFTGALENPPASEVIEQYPLEVKHADRYLGKLAALVERLGSGERTIWVIVSDHGEGLYRHGLLGHAGFAREDQLRILWLLRGPGVPPGRRIEAPAHMEDVLPTLLDVLGIPPPAGVTGVSRRSCWSGASCPEPEPWWAYGGKVPTRSVEQFAGYRWPFKLFSASGTDWELYDLARDPREDGALPADAIAALGEFPSESSRQRERTEAILAASNEPDPAKHSEMLRSLGYLQ